MPALLAFFVFTYVVGWTAFIAAARLAGSGAGLTTHPVMLLGVFAPGLVAVGLTALASGRSGVAALLGRIGRAPAAARWYVFALVYLAAVKLMVAGVHRIVLGVWPAFGRENPALMFVAAVFSTPVQAGEEVGWRGYALPMLADRMGLGRASILVGVIWAAWHLPLFFIAGTDKYYQSFPVYLLGVTALSAAMAWLYWRTGGSLLMTMLMHAAVNNTKDIVPSIAAAGTSPFTLNASPAAWLSVAVLWLCAGYFLARMRGARMPGLEPSPSEASTLPL